MKTFRVSCHSSCGTYFQAYLQHVDVVAINKDHAIALVEEWLKENKMNFIAPKNKWLTEELNRPEGFGVFDWHEDSDY